MKLLKIFLVFVTANKTPKTVKCVHISKHKWHDSFLWVTYLLPIQLAFLTCGINIQTICRLFSICCQFSYNACYCYFWCLNCNNLWTLMALWGISSGCTLLCQNVVFNSIQNLAPFWICFLESLHNSRDSSTWMCPPDQINYFCSLTGTCISQKNFTYRSVQIFKMLFQGFYAPESDPLHKIMRYWFYFSMRNWNLNMELEHGTGTGTLLSRWFPSYQCDQAEMFCNRLVPAPTGQIGGAGP